MDRILMIAFHYPPVVGSSGMHRTLNFSRYLPEFGWEPIILTARERAYSSIGADQYDRIPAGIHVERAAALDAGRHLSVRGHHIKFAALPDRWISWLPPAVLAGMRLIRRYRPRLLWATFPIATAPLIGLALHRLSGIPLIADFRDPMTEKDPLTGEEFPSDVTIRRVNRWIERPVVRCAERVVFTTPGAAEMHRQRYPNLPDSKWHVIPNGYDEESFREADAALKRSPPASRSPDAPLTLIHSGVIYPAARDPRAFFAAIGDLKRAGLVSSRTVQIVLRASGSEQVYGEYLREQDIADIVRLEGMIPYADALAEMMRADGLLIFQASNSNWQVPAKAYEYLRARRPILALTDPAGDTARVLKGEGIDTIARLDSREDIARGLVNFLERVRDGSAPIATDAGILRHSRRFRTQELASMLDSLRKDVGALAGAIGPR